MELNWSFSGLRGNGVEITETIVRLIYKDMYLISRISRPVSL
jgi:hypothetical protein